MRRPILIALVATAGAAGTLLASPQTGSGSSSSNGQGATTVTVRTRCAECRSRDEERARQKLEAKIDSIRWEFDHSKLTPSERSRLDEALTTTIRELMELEAGEDVVATTTARAAAVAGARARSNAPMAIAFSYTTAPRGYIGVTFDAPFTEDMSKGERMVRFYRYPRISLVEPASPADKAGVLEGDTLLQINGDDVKESSIPFGKLLVPDNKIVMRVRREGDSKDLKVIVGEPPMYWAGRMTPMPPAVPAPAAVRVRSPQPSIAVMPAFPAPPAGETPSGYVTVWTTNEAVAGAKLQTISEGLGKAVGVKNGVLVLTAAPGTPAYRSGLRDGDVIVRASGENVSTVRDFRALVQDADREDGVRVMIMRDKKTKEITLRW